MTRDTCRICIAGHTFDFHANLPGHPIRLGSTFQPFITPADDSEPLGRYTILPADRPALEPITGALQYSNDIWRLGANRLNSLTFEIHTVPENRWLPIAELAPDFSTGVIQPFAGRRGQPSDFSINYPYDQAILIYRLLHAGAIVVHGAGIVDDDNGYLFFGPSDIGKTTISRLWKQRGALLLNDDRSAITQAENGYLISGTPWHGEEPEVKADTGKLKAVIRLKQGPKNTLEAMSPGEALAEMLSCTIAPFYSQEGIERITRFMADLIEEVPAYRFTFKPEPGALDAFRSQVQHPGIPAGM